jgi:hypothetical protein
VRYHAFCSQDKDPGVKTYDLFNHDTDLSKPQDVPVYKIQNTGQRASIVMPQFGYENDSVGLTMTGIKCAREQSKRWAKANNKN